MRRVVDAFGRNRGVIAMTITNEVNVAISPNTSDGAYPRAMDALIGGIETAHAEAERRRFRQLRFGFTYAYRFAGDPAFFTYLGAHGGQAFRRAVDFVGLDFYPGTIVPPVLAPGDSLPHGVCAGRRDAQAQPDAAGAARDAGSRCGSPRTVSRPAR